MENRNVYSTFCLLCLTVLCNAQRIQLLTTPVTSGCPPTVDACVASNQVSLNLLTSTLSPTDPFYLPIDPDDGDPKRRFKAFWVMGDGNFLKFADTNTDAVSRTPPAYNYATGGTYQIVAYSGGKYSNKNWPKRAPFTVKTTTSLANTPTAFTTCLVGGNSIDLTSDHAIRKENLTAFVVSYAQTKQASGVYFFYNSATNTKGSGEQMALTTPVLRYVTTEMPNYFNGRIDATKISPFQTTTLSTAGAVDGLTFTNSFKSLSAKFRDVLYFPPENATASDMPSGFVEKRVFPILQADTTFTPADTLLNFFVVLTGPQSIGKNDEIQAILTRLSPNLSLTSSITQGGSAQYIQAVAEYALPYQVTFDPSQITVENIQQLGEDEHEVTFRLEMCNDGQGNVLNEWVSIKYSSDFQDFVPSSSFPISEEVRSQNAWNFKVKRTIPGRPSSAHESDCTSIYLKAKTNCAGVRSLWKTNPDQPITACVVFDGAISKEPECHTNFSIEPDQFKMNGQGNCVDRKN